MLVLVRHGEATHHTENLTGGWTNSRLTKQGEKQIAALAARLKLDYVTKSAPKIYASDLQRAKRSAEIIGAALGVKKIEACSFLREKNNGKAANVSEQEARQFFRVPCSDEELDHVNYEGGESRRDFFQRVAKGMELVPLSEGDVVLVAHKGTIQNIVFWWLGMSIEEVVAKKLSVDVRPASLTVLGINRWQEHAVFLLNDTSYGDQLRQGFGFAEFKK